MKVYQKLICDWPFSKFIVQQMHLGPLLKVLIPEAQ